MGVEKQHDGIKKRVVADVSPNILRISKKPSLTKKEAQESLQPEMELPPRPTSSIPKIYDRRGSPLQAARPPSFMEKFAKEQKEGVRRQEEGIIITESLDGVETKEKRSRRSRSALVGIVAALIMAGVFAVLLSTVFARLKIVIKPRVENLNLDSLTAAFDASVSKILFPQKVIPAELLEFPRKVVDTFETTGREYVEEKARGKVRVYNRFSSLPQKLIGGTRFLTESGILFRLPESITIPGAKIEEGKIIPNFIETELAADKVGEESNIKENAILKIQGFKGTAKYEGFYAEAPVGFSGGFKGETRVVSQDDLRKAQEATTKKAYDELEAEISRKVPPGFKLIRPLREIQIVKVEAPRPKTKADRFVVEVEAKGRVLIFRESDLVLLFKNLILKDDLTKELVEGSTVFDYRVQNADFDKKIANVVVGGVLKTKDIIPQEELSSLIKGRKEGTIIEILKGRSEISSFKLSFFPPWLFSAPDNAVKIRFLVE